jgi:hypothetical protein
MTKEQFDELYTKLYDAYADSILKDEYVRSSLGDALDHLIKIQSRNVND